MHRVACWQYLLKCVEDGDFDILNEIDCEQEELTLLRNQDIPTSRVLVEDESVNSFWTQFIPGCLTAL